MTNPPTLPKADMAEYPEEVLKAAESCFYGSEDLDGGQIIDKIATAILAYDQRDRWMPVESLKVDGEFPREVIVAAWNGEKYTISQACAFEDGAFRWCWETDLDETVADAGFDVHFWQPLPAVPKGGAA